MTPKEPANTDRDMWRLYVLGTYDLRRGDESAVSFESNKVRALLAYLVVEPEVRHSRDTLATLLWPDVPDAVARKNLRQALSNLRKVLGDVRAGSPYLLVNRHTVTLNPERPLWSDVGEFMRLWRAVEHHSHRAMERCPACAQRLQKAVDLYRGDFLAGFAVKHSNPFDDWLILTRERFHHQVVRALEILLHYYELAGELEAAQQCAEHLVRLDPWREEVYAELIRVLAARGRRSEALRVFKQCEEMLQQELNVSPSESTRLLVKRIQVGTPPFDVSPAPTNLPPEFTLFFGREAELLELTDYLVRPETRLITITGPGGVGKTRLALQVGSSVRAGFAHGVFFVPLVGVEGDVDLISAIAHALNLSLRQFPDPLDELVRLLADREVLLILDNYDHLMETRESLATLLRKTRAVVALVTSRRPLDLQVERVFPLYGLPYPSADGEGQGERCEAVRLFVERAQRVKPAFRYAGEDRHHVDRICRLAEGLPLAIELAAASVRQASCAQVAEQMAQGLDGLQVDWIDVDPRHRSLRRAFEQSWRLLSSEEQALFARLAVFRGAFSADAAAHVVGATQELLAALELASLITPVDDDMYRVHELLRQFAAEKLAPDEAHLLQRRHCAHYAAFLREQGELILSDRQLDALHRIEREFDNVRLAWKWATEGACLEELEHMEHPLYLFLEAKGRYIEGMALFQHTREHLERLEAHVPALLLWRVRLRLATFLYRTGDYSGAEALLQECCRAFHDYGWVKEEQIAWQTLSNVAHLQGKYQVSNEMARKALQLAMRVEEGYAVSMALNTLGLGAFMQGNYEEALALFRQSQEHVHDPWSLAVRLTNQGLVAYALGRYAEARSLYEQALAHWQEVGSAYGQAMCYNNLGLVAEAQRRWEEADLHYRRSIAICERLGVQEGVAAGLNNLGNVLVQLGDLENARQCYERAQDIRKQLDDRRGLISVANNLAALARRQGHPAEARSKWVHVLREALRHNVTPLALDSLYGLATLLADEGRYQEAALLLHLVQGHPSAVQATRDMAAELLDQIEAHVSDEQREEARRRAASLTLDQAEQLVRSFWPTSPSGGDTGGDATLASTPPSNTLRSA